MSRFKQKWFAGDTISVGIGQGYNIATPLQLAHGMAVVAADGKVHRPHLVQHVQDSRTNQLQTVAPQAVGVVALKPDNLERVKKALIDVTKPGGTAARASAGTPYTFAGKTGTAQVVSMRAGYVESRVHERHRDHALFIAYAPAENPTIAVAVLAENGGHGGSTAAPIARKVFDYFLLGKEPEPLRRAKVEEDDISD